MLPEVSGNSNQFEILSLTQCHSCHNNLKESEINKCSRCKFAIYCGIDCQKKDWPKHKYACINTATPYTTENSDIRSHFSNFDIHILQNKKIPKKLKHLKSDEYNHVLKTQQMILDGSKHLNPNHSIVVVCGAQFYDNKFVEPLPQLLERCKKLILIDVDPLTLENLHKMLGSSVKVSTVILDLTCSLKDLHAFYDNTSKSSPLEFCEKMHSFLEKVIEDINQRAVRLPGVLAETESADYVISSLVGSQLAVRLKEALFAHYLKKFNAPIRSFMEEQKEMEAKLSEVVQRCIHSLAMKHTEDLCAWAGKEGRVYLADSYKLNNNPLVSENTFTKISQILEKRKGSDKLTTKNWHWFADKNLDYTVYAIL